jgi:hypothetical protein
VKWLRTGCNYLICNGGEKFLDPFSHFILQKGHPQRGVRFRQSVSWSVKDSASSVNPTSDILERSGVMKHIKCYSSTRLGGTL